MDVNGHQNTPLYGTSAEFNYHLGSTTITDIASYRYFHRQQYFDNDFKLTAASRRPVSVRHLRLGQSQYHR